MQTRSRHNNTRSKGHQSHNLKRNNKTTIDTRQKREPVICSFVSRHEPDIILSSSTSSSPPQLNRMKKRSLGRHQDYKASFPQASYSRKEARGDTIQNIDETKEISEEEKIKYVAIDCEMVIVGGESTLARVSIVDWYGETLLNTFVKIEEVVTDYLTSVSGIRPSDIESEDAMTFNDCRIAVTEILGDKVVVGHALKNDFRALNITHPWYLTRDTAKFEPFMKPSREDEAILLPRKLKVLAELKLGMIIQEYGKEHDSIEDATAAMELYKKARTKWENAVEWKRRRTNAIARTNRSQ